MIYRSMAHLPIMGPRRRRKVEAKKPEPKAWAGIDIAASTRHGTPPRKPVTMGYRGNPPPQALLEAAQLDEQARRQDDALQAQMQQAAMGYYNPLAGYTGAYRPQSALGSMGNLGSAWPLAFGDIGERLGGSPK